MGRNNKILERDMITELIFYQLEMSPQFPFNSFCQVMDQLKSRKTLDMKKAKLKMLFQVYLVSHILKEIQRNRRFGFIHATTVDAAILR